MAKLNHVQFQVPYRDKMLEATGLLSRPWELFFRNIKDLLDPMGSEKNIDIVNNQATPLSIEGLSFSTNKANQGIVEYYIEIMTTGFLGVELIESGVFHVVRKAKSETWEIVSMPTPGPSTSGVSFSITTSGQIQYTSADSPGTPYVSRMSYRVRTLTAKNAVFTGIGPIP